MLYNIGMYLFQFVLKILALFNKKIKLGVEGRSNSLNILSEEINPNDKTLWFHCASLGEYEQGLPVFKEIIALHSNHKIVLTFFSPSGYEIRKNAEIADVVCYLPIDTKENARRFIELIRPELTVFVKYDIWPNYLEILKKNNLKSILISALYRQDQSYFKWYGRKLANALKIFNHIFVQNEESKLLLNKIGISRVSVSGDTRYDRVYNQLKINNSLPWLENFKKDNLLVVFGSTWPEDEKLIAQFINQFKGENTKFLIAPHEVDDKHIEQLKSKFNNHVKVYSENNSGVPIVENTLILNTIGQLSKAYSYADIAYVGGAVGNTGLHNILEPAVFGIPIIIGNNYKKFPEAIEMIKNKGVKSIKNFEQLNSTLNQLVISSESRSKTGKKNSEFILDQKGAVVQIIDYLRI